MDLAPRPEWNFTPVKSRNWSPVLQSMKEDKRNSQDRIQTQVLKNTYSESIITPAAKATRIHHRGTEDTEEIFLSKNLFTPSIMDKLFCWSQVFRN